MASPVFSTEFLDFEVAGARTTTYIVPDGFRAVVRDVSGTIQGDDVGPATVYCFAGSANFFSVQLPAQRGRAFHWDGRVVIAEGATIIVTTDADSAQFDVHVSGYLLSLP